MRQYQNIVLLSLLLLTLACKKEKMMPGGSETDEMISGTYDPTDYTFDVPDYMPTPVVPAENPMTEEGVALGRMLFYDPIFSADSSLSCAGCHDPKLAFTDGKALSTGILGIEGKRSAMSLVNLAYNTRGFFWDGRVRSLEEQALIPIEDHAEMADTWE